MVGPLFLDLFEHALGSRDQVLEQVVVFEIVMRHKEEESGVDLDIITQVACGIIDNLIQIIYRFAGLAVGKIHPGNFVVQDHNFVGIQFVFVALNPFEGSGHVLLNAFGKRALDKTLIQSSLVNIQEGQNFGIHIKGGITLFPEAFEGIQGMGKSWIIFQIKRSRKEVMESFHVHIHILFDHGGILLEEVYPVLCEVVAPLELELDIVVPEVGLKQVDFFEERKVEMCAVGEVLLEELLDLLLILFVADIALVDKQALEFEFEVGEGYDIGHPAVDHTCLGGKLVHAFG